MRDQAESLRLRLLKMQGRKEAKVMAIVSGKGGVGKSNFSLNFAINLTRKGHNVLLLDMDIGMGNIDILLGQSSKVSFIDIFQPNMSIQDIIKHGPKGLSYISGGTGLTNLFKLDDEKLNYLLNLLERLSLQYDYILFDMGAGITEETLQFLLSVHEIILITTPEPTSMTDAYSMLKFISSRDSDADFYLVVNRAQSTEDGTNTLKRLSHVIKQFLQKEVTILGYLPDDRMVNKAVSRQIPFSIFDPKSKVSTALAALTERYLLGKKEEFEKEKPPSFITRLRHYFSER
ncbi:flagellar biosynthesis protein FlhG [Bacillus mesophilus]|uniref:MinD/ParA family protein n=1 Tax=Bacillus mesophilus TaxID=1808955 RepID=A0A6M0Q1R8_9BACI|nr:MinD/ParA family protein [Bacillus mesophilus]MBM7659344.1 flagellar biosynthesis protein FlhG [Bacillus mesophilus]NEY70216.1 MinD/ParA family protein [Bacillus mesophilus]